MHSITRSARLATGLVAAAVVLGTVGAATAAAPELQAHERNEIRAAAKQYRDVDAALADGYILTSDCVEHPELGGMGYHYLRPDLVGDGVIDPTQPEILVYYPDRQGRLQLGAVEYFAVDADQDLSTDDDRPSLYGEHALEGPHLPHGPGQPIHYDLHVWVFKHNQAGELAGFNPAVSCSNA